MTRKPRIYVGCYMKRDRSMYVIVHSSIAGSAPQALFSTLVSRTAALPISTSLPHGDLDGIGLLLFESHNTMHCYNIRSTHSQSSLPAIRSMDLLRTIRNSQQCS